MSKPRFLNEIQWFPSGGFKQDIFIAGFCLPGFYCGEYGKAAASNPSKVPIGYPQSLVNLSFTQGLAEIMSTEVAGTELSLLFTEFILACHRKFPSVPWRVNKQLDCQYLQKYITDAISPFEQFPRRMWCFSYQYLFVLLNFEKNNLFFFQIVWKMEWDFLSWKYLFYLGSN